MANQKQWTYRGALLCDDRPQGAHGRQVVEVNLEPFDLDALQFGQVEVVGLGVKAGLHEGHQRALVLLRHRRGTGVLDRPDEKLQATR